MKRTTSKTPALQWLLAADRDAPIDAAALDWRQFVEHCDRHGLTAWAHWQLGEGATLPDPARRELRELAIRNAGQTLRNRIRLRALLRSLAEVGVVPVVLKGCVLGARIYPEPLLRYTSDIDIMVAPDQLQRTRETLASSGWTLQAADDDHYPPAYNHHDTWRSPGMIIELHRWLVTSFGTRWGEPAATMPYTVEAELDGVPLRLLEPELELVFLTLHAANHLAERLSWLLDLKLFCDHHPNLDWDRFERHAAEAGLLDLCWAALEAAAVATNSAPLRRAADRHRPGRLVRIAVRRGLSPGLLLVGRAESSKLLWIGCKTLLAPHYGRWLRFGVSHAWWRVARTWATRGQRASVEVA